MILMTNPMTRDVNIPSLSEIPSLILSMSLQRIRNNSSLETPKYNKEDASLCDPRCKVHVRCLVVPCHLLAQYRTEEMDPDSSDLFHGHLIEEVNEEGPGDHLKGTEDHQPDEIRQRIRLNQIDQLIVGGIVAETKRIGRDNMVPLIERVNWITHTT